MIDNRDDLNRPRVGNDDLNRPRVGNTGFGWGVPLGIAALAIVLGFFFLSPRGTTTTATNSPTTTQSMPAPAPVTPAPAPARPATGG